MKPTLHTLSATALLAACLVGGSAWGAAPQKAAHPAPASLAKKPVKPTGALKAPYDQFSLGLVSWDGERILQAESKDGVAHIPPGNYWVTGWEIHTKDAAGHLWRAQGGCMGQPQTAVRITPGSLHEIRLATPLRVDLQIDQVDTEFSFLMRFIGTGGDRCTRIFMDGQDPPAPKLKVTDADGAPVATLDFKYGCGFVCRKNWKAPDGVKWPLKATVQIDFGPFPVQPVDPIELRREKPAPASQG